VSSIVCGSTQQETELGGCGAGCLFCFCVFTQGFLNLKALLCKDDDGHWVWIFGSIGVSIVFKHHSINLRPEVVRLVRPLKSMGKSFSDSNPNGTALRPLL
jgi:hypothetical protein